MTLHTRPFEIASTTHRASRRVVSAALAVLMASLTISGIDSLASRDLGAPLWAKITQSVT